MLRVCHIVSSFRPVIGGAERATETLTAELRRQGADAIVLTRRYSHADLAFEVIAGVPVRRLGVPGRGKRHALTFGLHALVLLAWQLRAYRLLHVQNIDTPMLVAMLARILLRKRVVATIHGESPLIGAGSSALGRLRLRSMVRLVDAFTAINPENRRRLVESGVSADRVHMIPNGIDMSVFRPPSAAERLGARESLDLPPDALVVLYLGRLVPFKRVDLLIEAWARPNTARDRRLVVVGTGPEADALQALATRLGIDVRFDGPTDTSVRYLRAADIFVLPSGDEGIGGFEGLSVSLLEAMAVGITVIVTRGPGNDVLVQERETGLTFSMGRSDELAERLEEALGSNELRQALGRNASHRVQAGYAITAVAGQVIDLYRHIRGDAGGPV